MESSEQIVVVGLGYVGLPLAVALARHFDVTGFDIDPNRVGELREDFDRTREVSAEELKETRLLLTHSAGHIRGGDVYIVTVPTPVDADHQPDLGAVLGATREIAAALDPAKRPTIVYESTVYPGVTEDICGAEIERTSGLKRGRDFRLGYSPERINPGDKTHTIDKITKVIAGEDEEVGDQLERIYGAVTGGDVFRAASIKAAEAAKVIENAQRDINIAFMNEVAQICGKVGISVWDVLAAARTKWNFLPFEPGLVGGHCIGVDPYYLSHLAQKLGHDPRVILSGRGINDMMPQWIADALHERRGSTPGRALVLGLTFKENVPDIRNSRAIDLVRRLQALGHEVDVADPFADAHEVHDEYGLRLTEPSGPYDLVIGAVAHSAYRGLVADRLVGLLAEGGTLADLKGMWRDHALPDAVDRWTL